MAATDRFDFCDPVGLNGFAPFLRHVRECEAFRQRPSWSAYERHKADFQRQFPEASSAEYEQAMAAISQICGV